MLDICTCIISFIVFSDLVPDLYFQDTDTWDSCDMHYLDYMTFIDIPCYFILWSWVLVIILHDSYLSRTSHAHYIHVTPCMYDLIVHDLSSWLFLLLLLFSVLDTAKHIMLMSYLLLLHFHILSFIILLPSCALVGPLMTDLYIIFQYLDQEAGKKSYS